MAAADALPRAHPAMIPGNSNVRWMKPRGANLGGMSQHDVAIIGGGAAGLSAALVLSRAGRTVLVLDAGTPRNAPAAHMHGYLSRDGLPPQELLAHRTRRGQGYGGELVEGPSPRSLPTAAHGFRVHLDDGRHFTARRLLVTTGLSDELPDIPGLRDRWARDVLHCPYCHGHEVRDHRLGVIGGNPVTCAMRRSSASGPTTWSTSRHPTPSPPTSEPELDARAIGIVECTIEGLVVADDRLRGVQMDDGCVVPRDALFVPPRFVPNSSLLVGLGCLVDADGWVVADTVGRTSVPGIWAAGNVVDPRAQVITAAGAGSTTAIALNADLVEDDVRVALG